MTSTRFAVLAMASIATAACGGARSVRGEFTPGPTASNAHGPSAALRDSQCEAVCELPVSDDVATAMAQRIADLKARGGDCQAYAVVLESSLAAGRIKARPYMWRVGANLASASATPSGDLTFAREIDSLNVGVRTIDDVLWSVEHEAAHIAFHLPAGSPANEQLTDDHVRACRTVPRSASAARRNNS